MQKLIKISALLLGTVIGLQGESCLKQTLTSGLAAGKSAIKYLVSTGGLKDIAGLYCMGMGLTLCHELGHAVSARLLWEAPLDLTLGAMRSRDKPTPRLRIGPIKLAGFNPATGYAHCRTPQNRTRHAALKRAIMYCAGPLCGLLGGIAGLMLLKRYEGWYLTKCACWYSVFNHTLGAAGLGGALYEALCIKPFSPKHDLTYAFQALKSFFHIKAKNFEDTVANQLIKD